uniref:Uncharacterized protein n=1 Tax=Mesocestoides corti TaxID=53468 RepID=A0A5K3F6U6_MESCO
MVRLEPKRCSLPRRRHDLLRRSTRTQCSGSTSDRDSSQPRAGGWWRSRRRPSSPHPSPQSPGEDCDLHVQTIGFCCSTPVLSSSNSAISELLIKGNISVAIRAAESPDPATNSHAAANSGGVRTHHAREQRAHLGIGGPAEAQDCPRDSLGATNTSVI